MPAIEATSRSVAVRAAGLLLLLVLSVPLCGCGDQLASHPQQGTDSTQHASSQQNLERLSLALHQYHKEYQSFPPAYVLADNDERWHSWRILILPYLGDAEKELYSRYRFDEPWNGPHNAKLASSMPDVFASPYADAKPNTTPYLAAVGRRTMWPGPFCCKFRDVTDGVSNTLQLIENPDSDRNWMEPRDFTHREAQQFFKQRSRAAGDEGAFHIAMGDSRIVLLQPSKADRLRFHGWLTPHGGQPLVSAEQLPDEELELPDFDFGEPQNAASAKQTLIMPHLEAKLTPEENQIYCATFQLAWDELRKVYRDEDIRLRSPNEMAVQLNRRRFPRESLDPACYAALSGSIGEIEAAMAKLFPDVSLNLTPPPPSAFPYVTCYSYLEKRLPFDEEFDSLEKPILFGSSKEAVKGFGLRPTERDRDTGSAILESQVEVLDYMNDDDFVLRLSTIGPQQDWILLAKVKPDDTLQATLDAVRARIEQPHQHHTRRHLETVDTLAIPIVLFNHERTYDELEGCHLTNDPPPGREYLGTNPWIEVARQMIQFRLDETGGLLVSEAELQVVASLDEPEPPPPPKPRHFIFDQPFLMVLQEQEATAPYLVAWIANAEVMERQGRK